MSKSGYIPGQQPYTPEELAQLQQLMDECDREIDATLTAFPWMSQGDAEEWLLTHPAPVIKETIEC